MTCLCTNREKCVAARGQGRVTRMGVTHQPTVADLSGMSDASSVFHREPGAPAPSSSPTVATQPAPTLAAASGSQTTGVVVAVAIAIAGGLIWAGVVIATRFDVGILAWFVGAAAGLAAVRVAGGTLGVGNRVLVGLFAAGAILLGKYVIFVHDAKDALDKLLPGGGSSIGYLDSQAMRIYVDDFSQIVKPIYALWVLLAFVGALRATSGARVLPRRRHLF